MNKIIQVRTMNERDQKKKILLNLNQINKEKDGIIKIISWVYTVQDKV